jgi:hypothetical protein
LVAFYIIGLPLSLLLGFKLGFHTKVQTDMFVLLKLILQTAVFLTDHVQITCSRGYGWARYAVSLARTPFSCSSHYEPSGKEWS